MAVIQHHRHIRDTCLPNSLGVMILTIWDCYIYTPTNSKALQMLNRRPSCAHQDLGMVTTRRHNRRHSYAHQVL
jgi:hypothetical protein